MSQYRLYMTGLHPLDVEERDYGTYSTAGEAERAAHNIGKSSGKHYKVLGPDGACVALGRVEKEIQQLLTTTLDETPAAPRKVKRSRWPFSKDKGHGRV